MPGVLVFCEADEKGIRSTSLPALTAGAALAKQSGGELVAVVIGKGVSAAAADAAKHVKRVLVYDDAKLEAPLAETWAPQLADAVKRAGASALLGTASSTGKDILPRAAALLGAGMASDITAVVAANRFKRPAYAGNAIEDVEIAGSVVVASVRQTAFPPMSTAAGGARARSKTSRSAPSTRWAPSWWRCTRRRRARGPTSARPDRAQLAHSSVPPTVIAAHPNVTLPGPDRGSLAALAADPGLHEEVVADGVDRNQRVEAVADQGRTATRGGSPRRPRSDSPRRRRRRSPRSPDRPAHRRRRRA